MSSAADKIKDKVAGQHLAAVLPSQGAALTLQHRKTPAPGPEELLVEVHSIALNPIDWKQRASGFAIAGYPAVLGSDIAGVVVSAGSSVSADAPKPGTRIAAFAPCFFAQGAPDYGALQTRVLVPAANATPLPDGMSFNEASLLPMAVATAWSAWHTIGISRDTAYTPADKRAILIWSGASSVGSAAIQIASLMGFSVYATASEKHHGYLKGLGATRLFDYKDANVVQQIVKAAKADGVDLHQAFYAAGALQSCLDILKELNPHRSAKIASAPRVSDALPKMEGIEVIFVLPPTEEKARTDFYRFIFNVWLKEKLEKGDFVPSPKIEVLAGGLESAQKGLDQLEKGVSGVKLVLEV